MWKLWTPWSYLGKNQVWSTIGYSSCVPGSLYATHVAQPVARLDAVGGVQGAKHAEQAVIITSQSSDMLVFWVILEMLMHIFHAVLSVCFPAPIWF